MFFSNSNRALLQGMMAGALVLASASACSRSDRTESGSDTSAALMQDTASTAPYQSTTAPATAPPSAELQDTSLQGDSAAAGYRAMEPDTVTVPESDSARVTEDTSEISADTVPADSVSVEAAGAGQVSDTAAVSVGIDATVDTSAIISDTTTIASDTVTTATDTASISDTSWTEMARDTSTAADQMDTTGAAEAWADTNLVVGAADTTDNAGRIRPPEDSTEILGEVTTNANVATADTIESDRIRPPEDSTELYGDPMSDETADEREVSAEDREVVATSDNRTDEVGAAAIAGNVTGTEAVALVTRQGAACIVVNPEINEQVRWDMSSTPVSVNPCGLGSMNLSKVKTEE